MRHWSESVQSVGDFYGRSARALGSLCWGRCNLHVSHGGARRFAAVCLAGRADSATWTASVRIKFDAPGGGGLPSPWGQGALRRSAARLTQRALPQWNCPEFSRPLPVGRVPRATQVDLDNIYAEVPDLYADGLLGVTLRNAMPEQDINPTLGVGVAQTMRTG